VALVLFGAAHVLLVGSLIGLAVLLGAAAPAPSYTVGPVTVTGKRSDKSSCPQVGSQPDYACLNAQLKSVAASAQPQPAGPSSFDIVGNGQPDKVGTFSFSGTAEQMGSNFGKSAYPYRPNAPVYAPPVAPRPPK
jgi:hypothetical protein